MARKRQIRRNPPPEGIKWGKGKEKGDPKHVSHIERVRAYPDEEFTVNNNKLFCSACQKELSTKKSSVESDVRSQKHVNRKKRLALKSKREYDIAKIVTCNPVKLTKFKM